MSILFVSGCTLQDIDKHQYYERGVNLLKEGNPDGAIIAFQKAIEKDRSYFEARYKLAAAFYLAGRHGAAEKEFLKVLYLNPSFSEARLSLARVYIKSGRADPALKEIMRYMKDVEDNPEAYEIAASAYASKKEYHRAEEIMQKSLRISPLRVTSKILLAEIFLKDNKVSRAESLVNEVLDVDPRNSGAGRLMARIRQGHDNH